MRRGRASLIGALFGRVGLLTVAIVLAIGLVAFQTARQRIDEAYDGQLMWDPLESTCRHASLSIL